MLLIAVGECEKDKKTTSCIWVLEGEDEEGMVVISMGKCELVVDVGIWGLERDEGIRKGGFAFVKE